MFKMKKLEKKDMVAQITNIKSDNCFSQTNSPNIILTNKYSCTVFHLQREDLRAAGIEGCYYFIYKQARVSCRVLCRKGN